jgi:hypothetical protein
MVHENLKIGPGIAILHMVKSTMKLVMVIRIQHVLTLDHFISDIIMLLNLLKSTLK